jgi:ketosteroid isomerase-like protein
MWDPIAPALARRPAEAAELVCLAISDGDLEAALAQYEKGAVLRPLATSADGLGESAADDVAGELAALMDFRLPLALHVRAVVPGNGVALVLAERHMRGTGSDGQTVRLSGSGATLVRRGPDGTWRIAADAWGLIGEAEPA